MTVNTKERSIPLRALSNRQRRIVQRHLPLVHLTLNRMQLSSSGRHEYQERGELFQEGSLALVEAFRGHDPERHGSFAAYAMARVHFSMSEYLHERIHGVRVPFSTQRRRRARMYEHSRDRHRPDAPPRMFQLPDFFDHSDRRRHDSLHEYRSTSPTIGDLVRDRYDAAAAAVVREMNHDPTCRPDTARLLSRCHDDRWTIPETEAQTPIRRLAREIGCSLGRVTHCEERFRRRVAERLRSDEVFQILLDEAESRRNGLRDRMPSPPSEPDNVR